MSPAYTCDLISHFMCSSSLIPRCHYHPFATKTRSLNVSMIQFQMYNSIRKILMFSSICSQTLFFTHHMWVKASKGLVCGLHINLESGSRVELGLVLQTHCAAAAAAALVCCISNLYSWNVAVFFSLWWCRALCVSALHIHWELYIVAVCWRASSQKSSISQQNPRTHVYRIARKNETILNVMYYVPFRWLCPTMSLHKSHLMVIVSCCQRSDL